MELFFVVLPASLAFFGLILWARAKIKSSIECVCCGKHADKEMCVALKNRESKYIPVCRECIKFYPTCGDIHVRVRDKR